MSLNWDCVVELLCRVELAQFQRGEEKFCANKAKIFSIIILLACHSIFCHFIILKCNKILDVVFVWRDPQLKARWCLFSFYFYTRVSLNLDGRSWRKLWFITMYLDIFKSGPQYASMRQTLLTLTLLWDDNTDLSWSLTVQQSPPQKVLMTIGDHVCVCIRKG